MKFVLGTALMFVLFSLSSVNVSAAVIHKVENLVMDEAPDVNGCFIRHEFCVEYDYDTETGTVIDNENYDNHYSKKKVCPSGIAVLEGSIDVDLVTTGSAVTDLVFTSCTGTGCTLTSDPAFVDFLIDNFNTAVQNSLP